MEMRSTTALFVFLALVALMLGAAHAQTSPAEDAVSAEQIETEIQAIEVRTDLDDETRAAAVGYLRDAQAQIEKRLAAIAAAESFADAINTAPDETSRLRDSLEQEPAPAPTAETLGVEDLSLAELEQTLSQELAVMATAEERLANLETRIVTRGKRPAAARQRIGEIEGSRDELSSLIDAEPPPGEAAVLTDARRLSARLKRDALAAESVQLNQELLSHGARLELLNVRRDVAVRESAQLRQRVAFLRSVVNSARQSSVEQAQQAAAEAESATAGKHPVVRTLAEENASLTNELPAIAADIERVTHRIREAQSEAQQIEQSLARSRQRLDIGGVSQAIGRLLVEERRVLPGVSRFEAEARARRGILSRIGLAQLRIKELQQEITPIDPFVEETMLEVTRDVAAEDDIEVIRAEVTELLKNRRELLDKAASTYNSYLRALDELDVVEQRQLDSAAEYREFLDRNLLWIPSSRIISLDTFTDLREALARALSPTSWARSVKQLPVAMQSSRATAIAALLLLAAAVFSRRPLSHAYKAINGKVGRLSTDNIGLTFAALVISAVRALPVPLAIAIVGWAIRRVPDTTEFSIAVSGALVSVAPFLYNLLLFRVLCAKDGVATVHFSWQEQNTAIIRRKLDLLIMLGTPLVFLAVLAYDSPVAAYRDSLGRLAFIAFMMLFVVVIRPLGDPKQSVAKAYYEKRPDSWASRLKWLWYSIEIGAPIALLLLASVGFLYTAAMLTGHLVSTIWLVLGIVLANLIVLRWLALARRKIEWQLALEKREGRKAEVADEGRVDTDGEIPVVEPKSLDLDAVDQQTRRLLRAGLVFVGVIGGWAIWSEVLPALSILEDVELWSQSVTVDGVDTIAPVTLADLLLALVVAVVTAVASRNLPGLMEIAVLQRLDMERSSRYTINTLLRYAVVTVGVISILNIIGWSWSRIQWLVAALSVGLGFGLQEIVANFVSGLIILFERPVRVGDTVTVGQLTGTVSRVRIRATTITDWDRKEIIVPNKSFITEQVVNWTLTDPITRVIVPVGISYGSDVERATAVMEETLQSMPLVLDDPAPRVYFLGFGESSLDFKLFAYSRELGDRLPLTHAVHGRILAALREHGFVIPFPQRDLHMHTVDDIEHSRPGDRDS